MNESAPSLENVEAERAVLGLLLRDDRRWWDIADRLIPSDFADVRNRMVFDGMALLVGQGRPIVKQVLLSQCCGSEWVTDHLDWIIQESPEGGDIGVYVDAILHASGRRRLIKVAGTIYDKACNASLDISIEEIRGEAVALIESTNSTGPEQAESLSDLVGKVLVDTQEAINGNRPAGIQTGFASFDELVGPLLPGQLIVIGGETGAGKTALALQIGAMVAERKVPVYIASQEMDGSELTTRLLAVHSQLPSDKIAVGELTDKELERLFERGQHTKTLPMWIDSTPSQMVKTLQARIARSIAKHGVKLAIIDHLQFIKPERSRGKEHEEIRQSVDDIKAMAKRLRLPVILLSHVSRSADVWMIQTAMDLRRPTLRDLYGSSAIEKAADAVVFVHRPYWFLERASPGKRKAEWECDMLRWQGKAELILPKRRGGRGYGEKEVYFNEPLTWFHDEPRMELVI